MPYLAFICNIWHKRLRPAFTLAVGSDRDLFIDAWNRNALLASPSTLPLVVRTVAHLWRQEAQGAFDDASSKLSNVCGDLVGHAQKLRQLGVKPSKSSSPALVDGAYESDELPFVLEGDNPAPPPANANGRALDDLT
jgi:DNA recombination protein RmuC